MNYKDLRSIQETYNVMYTEGYGTSPNRDPLVPKSHNERMKDAREKTKKQGVFLPPWIGPELPRVKAGSKTQMASYEPEGEMTEGLAGMVDKATKAGQAGLEKMGVKINRTPRPTARPSATTSNTMRQNQSSMEEVDVFDIVKGYIIDEGATEEEAIKVMLAMTEEDIDAVVEAYVVTNADKKGNTPAYQNYMKGMKGKDGKPLYKAAPHLKGV